MAKNKLNLGDILEDVAARVEEASAAQNTPVEQGAQITGKLAPEVKPEPVAETRKGPKPGTVGKNHVLNANLNDEIYWRAEMVKKRLNKERGEDAPFVSLNTMLCNALEVWLDQNYPETKKQYQQAKKLGIL